jgi:hypothetical protein
MRDQTVERLMEDDCRALAVKSNLAIMQALEAQIKIFYSVRMRLDSETS